MRLRSYWWGWVFCGIGACFADQLPELTSDEPIVFDQEKKTVTGKGNAQVLFKSLAVQADTIAYSQDENTVEAIGGTRVTDQGLRFVSNKAAYDLKSREFKGEKFRLETQKKMIQGEAIHGTDDHIMTDNSRIYYSAPGVLTPNVSAKSIELQNKNLVVFRNAILRIGHVPVFYTPYYEHSLDESFVRWKADYGYGEVARGNFLRNDVAFNYRKNFKPGFLFDHYSKRGILFGPTFEYAISNPDYAGSGNFFSGFIKDELDEHAVYQTITDVLGRPLPRHRRFIDWKHKQTFYGHTDVTAMYNYWRDSRVLEDFRPLVYPSYQNPDNFVEIAHRREHTVTSLLTRFRVNDFQVVQERLPDIHFELAPIKLGESDFYQNFHAGVARMRQKPVPTNTTDQELITNRLDTYYGLYYPIELTNWSSLTPVAGTRLNHYFRSNGGRDDYTRLLGEAGFDVRLTAYGQWKYKNEYWSIDGIRHKVVPVFQYRYLPGAEAGRNEIPPIDEQPNILQKSLTTIDLGTMRDIDRMSNLNVVRIGFENFFQTKDTSSYAAKDLAFAHLYQDFYLSPKTDAAVTTNPTKQRYSELFGKFGLNPAPWLSFSTYTRFAHDIKRFKETTSTIAFSEGDSWKLTFGTNYLRESFTQYTAGFSYNFTSCYAIEGTLSFDAKQQRLIQQIYTFKTILSHCWDVRYQFKWKKLSQEDILAEKNEWEIRVVFSLI